MKSRFKSEEQDRDMFMVSSNRGFASAQNRDDFVAQMKRVAEDEIRSLGIPVTVATSVQDRYDSRHAIAGIGLTYNEFVISSFLVSFYLDGTADLLDLSVVDSREAGMLVNGSDPREKSFYEDCFLSHVDGYRQRDDMLYDFKLAVSEYLQDDSIYKSDESAAHAYRRLYKTAKQEECTASASSGITQPSSLSWMPNSSVMMHGHLAKHDIDVPTTDGSTDKASVASLKKHLGHQFKGLERHASRVRSVPRSFRRCYEAEDDFGMNYRFYSLLYGQRSLSDVMSYPSVDGAVHDFEFWAASPNGVQSALVETGFLKKQDYAVINNIRSDYTDVIVGYVIPESVTTDNTWEYAEVSVGMEQNIRVTWRH